MTRQMLRAKVHRISVTDRNVAYDGSLTLDEELMQAADLLPHERIEVYDVDKNTWVVLTVRMKVSKPALDTTHSIRIVLTFRTLF